MCEITLLQKNNKEPYACIFAEAESNRSFLGIGAMDGYTPLIDLEFTPIFQTAEIVTATPNACELIERAGRVCYKSESKGDPDKFIRARIKQGHTSILEHAVFTAKFICDRAIATEITRHRHSAFTPGISMESTRYVDYDGKLRLIVPVMRPEWDEEVCVRKLVSWAKAGNESVSAYRAQRKLGIKAEDARDELPLSTAAELYFTASMREWREFFKLRLALAAHHKIRVLAKQLYQEAVTRWPALFEGIAEVHE